MSWNLPPGCTENDLPGWLDIETTIDVVCPECETKFDEMEVCISSSDDIEVECEKCGAKWYESFSYHFPTD